MKPAAEPAKIHLRVESGDRPAYDGPRKKRRGGAPPVPIQAFVGPNGSGKTLAVVELVVLPTWEAGRRVVSNMPLYPEALGFPADLYQPLTGWRDIVKMGTCQEKDACPPGECPHSSTDGYGCSLVLDEASAALPSRASASAPAQLIRVLNQLRKRDVLMAWTAPAYQRMDIAVREMTQAVTVCDGRFPDAWSRVSAPGVRRWFPPRDREAGRIERGWRPNRLFSFVTYEAVTYDEFTLGKTAQLRPRARRTYWRSRHDAQHAYGTLQGVDMLDHVDLAGSCMDCGLTRKRGTCSCHAEEARSPEVPKAPEGGGRTGRRTGAASGSRLRGVQ